MRSCCGRASRPRRGGLPPSTRDQRLAHSHAPSGSHTHTHTHTHTHHQSDDKHILTIRLVRSILFPKPTTFKFNDDSFKFIAVMATMVRPFLHTVYYTRPHYLLHTIVVNSVVNMIHCAVNTVVNPAGHDLQVHRCHGHHGPPLAHIRQPRHI